MKPYLYSALVALLSSSAMAYDVKSGGKTSVKKDGANAYSLPAANLPMSKRLDFSVGNSFFRNPWVQAPASTDARDGLGPLFNTNGCQNCHIKDGRGHPPEKDDLHAVSMLVRLSIPAMTPEQKKRTSKMAVSLSQLTVGSYKILHCKIKRRKAKSISVTPTCQLLLKMAPRSYSESQCCKLRI